jgi:dynein heavy chain 2
LRASKFREILRPVEKTWAKLDSLSWEEVLELEDETKDVFDDLWKQMEVEPLYPEERMEHLLQVWTRPDTLSSFDLFDLEF